MKKLVLTVAIVIGIAASAMAQNPGGGLFGKGETEATTQSSELGGPCLPPHNQNTNQPAPLGSGALLLIGFGAAYAISKRKE